MAQVHLITRLLFIHYHHDSTDRHKAHYSQLCMWQSRENTPLALCFNSHPCAGSRCTHRERNQTIKEWKHQARDQHHETRTLQMNTHRRSAHAIPLRTHWTVSYQLYNHMKCLANWEKTTSDTFLLFSLSLSSDLFMFLEYCLRCLDFVTRRVGRCSLNIMLVQW